MKRLLVIWLFSLAMVAMVSPVHANLILNGSFEVGTDPNPGFTTLGSGDPNITNWTVGGSIDYMGDYWQAADGVRSIDLNGFFAEGSVSQSFTTAVGQSYHVTFYMAGNPDGEPSVKTLVASDGGSQVFTFDIAAVPSTHENMGWEQKEFDFIAGGTGTTLTFASSNDADGAYGPALDQVSVNAVPEPGTLILLGSGLLGLALTGMRKKFRK